MVFLWRYVFFNFFADYEGMNGKQNTWLKRDSISCSSSGEISCFVGLPTNNKKKDKYYSINKDFSFQLIAKMN